MEMQLQTKDTLATLYLDPRTKLYLLIVGNVALFLAPSLLYEIALVVCVVILGILVGAKRFTVRMADAFKKVAKKLAKDGEGATKLLICKVDGAKDDKSAKVISKSIRN